MIKVAVFAFNKPQNLEKLLNTLISFLNIRIDHINIYVDKAERINKENEKVFKLLRKKKYQNEKIKIIKRDKHYGLKDNLIKGITETLEIFGEALFLEEDLEITEASFDFIDKYSKYLSNGKIMHLSLFTPIKNQYSFISKVMFCWGWFTNLECWNSFTKDNKFKNNPRELDYPLSNFFSDTYRKNLENKINSWAISWYVSIRNKNGFCLNPPSSLVINNGFGKNATHTKTSSLMIPKKINVYNSSQDKLPNVLVEKLTIRIKLGLFYFLKTNLFLRLISKVIFYIEIYFSDETN